MITWSYRRTEDGAFEVGHTATGRWQAEEHQHSDRFTATARARWLNELEAENAYHGRTPALPYDEEQEAA